MKKTHIIGLIVIAVAVGAILTTISDSSTFVSFNVAADSPGEEVQVVGELNKDKDLVYNPEEDANLFQFYMKDKEGNEQQVMFHGTKPQDFERSEQLVVTGKFKEDGFHASKILMKCPSKYNNGGSDLVEVSENGKNG